MRTRGKTVLNLGCGNRIVEGAINVDRTRHRPEVDEVVDLEALPWPWEDGSFDKVLAIAVFEHLRHSLLVSMEETWRILRVGGIAVVKLPAWDHEVSWNDLTHEHKVGAGAFDQLDPRTARGREYVFYTRCKWAIRKRVRGTTSYWWTVEKMRRDWDGKE